MSKKILITGVSKGLGRAVTEEFVRAGHTVIGCARTEETVAQLNSVYGAPHDFAALNVVNDAEVERWAKRVLERFGPPDLILNNAAIVNRNAPLWSLTAGEFDPVIDINIKGVVNVIRHFAPPMIAKGSGVIVNFSSGWGRSTSPEVAPYCATKWAIEGLSQAMAQEVPSGLAVVPVNPGIIDTEMLRSCFGSGASGYPTAEEWAKKAAPFFLKLGPKDNGKSLTVS